MHFDGWIDCDDDDDDEVHTAVLLPTIQPLNVNWKFYHAKERWQIPERLHQCCMGIYS